MATVFTVGYGDIIPTTELSRFMAMLVMVLGIGSGVSALQGLFDSAIKREPVANQDGEYVFSTRGRITDEKLRKNL